MSVRLRHPQFGLASDTPLPITVHRQTGSSFAVRRLSHNAARTLTVGEVETYRTSGLGLVAVFDDDAEGSHMGLDQGRDDAQFAREQAQSLGMPAGRPIFFTVRSEASADPAATDSYFDGVASVLGHEASGPYGGFGVVRHQADRGFAWGWQTYAWSGSELEARVQLYEFSTDHYIDGVRVSYNHAFFADYGQWQITSDLSPDPDPHHYEWFPEGPFVWQDKVLYERRLVQDYDRYRIAPHVGANSAILGQLREDLTLARKRVWFEAHVDSNTGTPEATPEWAPYHRGWRWQQLLARSQGARVV
jgi:hypothetical protein